MRVAWYEETGAAETVLQLGEQDAPAPAAGEVQVRIKASGINPSDVKTRAGARGPLAFALVIPHSDGAGIIEAVGAGVDAARVGERVWLWNAAWKRAHGTACELITLPAEQAVTLPDNTDFDAGACLGIPGSTACYGVFADGSVKDKCVLVTGGAGAVGHYAIQLAKWGGAKVIATVSSDAKGEFAKAAGADLVVNYKQQDVAAQVMEATAGQGVDRIVDVEFGGNLDVSKAVLGVGGTICTYGSMGDPTPTLPF